MTTEINSLTLRRMESGTQDLTVTAKADRYGDVMMTARVDFEDGHTAIATMTVTHDQVMVASDHDVKQV